MSLWTFLSRNILANPLNSFDAVSGTLLGMAATGIVYKTTIRTKNWKTNRKIFIILGILYVAYRLAKILRKQYKALLIRSSPFKPRIVIIGAGLSGLCMAIKLKHELGYDNFIIYEMLSDLGGTWFANTYPGCCCDVAGDLYSYSFAPNPMAQRAYPTQSETLQYIKQVANKYDLYKYIQFNTQVIGCKYDENTAQWTVQLKHVQNDTIQSVKANFVVSAVGLLVIPKYPNIANLKAFKGKMIHSAQWEHGYDFQNKRIAVIGTGCSAIQLVPTLIQTYGKHIKRMDVYQRTPGHIFPKEDYKHSAMRQFLYYYLPWTLKLKRYFLYWRHDVLIFPALRKDSKRNKQFEELCGEYRNQMVCDTVLRKKLRPSFPFGAKRILVEDGYYSALQETNVGLLTSMDGHGIDCMMADGIKLKNGDLKEYDCIILCTGYETEEFLKSIPNGVVNTAKNMEIKKDIFNITDAKAYIGRTVSNFPNWFQILGPGSGLGHSSMILIIENDANYIKQIIEKFLVSHGKFKSIEVKEKCMDEFVDRMDAQMQQMVWSDENTTSWYKNKHQRVAALFGWSTVYHWWISRKVEWSHYTLT